MTQTQSPSDKVTTKVYKMNDNVQKMWWAIPIFGIGMGAILLVAALRMSYVDIATRAMLIGGAVIIALIGILVFLGARHIRLVTSSRGVTLYGIGYTVYTPWSNIKKLATDQYGGNSMYGTRFYQPSRTYEGFLFYRPAVSGLPVKEGMRRNVAVIHGWALMGVQISRYTNMLPLTGFLNDFTRKELLNDAKKYAPDTFGIFGKK
ncbi:hypothetical protein KDH_70960 [Dictyobacter sp. S3.2.2.5]|uniref:Uncharacterized protein n=1 Tax=Dictyobacter halimunensis TaxID=3026934 RepID=A0ABQ6G2F0_9CHLR|nr:hypothetical protein KDH_70960 [Dictyobacter sp. S3.2.2.5]